MKIIRSIGIALALVFGLSFSLAGCSNQSGLQNESDPSVNVDGTSEWVYVNQDTGLVTKYVDKNGEVKFDKGYTKEDFKFKAFDDGFNKTEKFSLNDTYEVKGKTYDVPSYILPVIDQPDYALIPFYNDALADWLKSATYTLKDNSIRSMVAIYVERKILNSIKTGEIPGAQYELGRESKLLCGAFGLNSNGDQLINDAKNLFPGLGISLEFIATPYMSIDAISSCDPAETDN
jgi:hypothetical protein